jgi:hypothetical protein
MQLTIDDIDYTIPIMDDGALLAFVEATAAMQVRDSMSLSDAVGLLILSEAMDWGLTQDQLSANSESIMFAYLAANMGLQRLLVAIPDQYSDAPEPEAVENA